MLLDAKADLTSRTDVGATPLALAIHTTKCFISHRDILRTVFTLVSHGASWDASCDAAILSLKNKEKAAMSKWRNEAPPEVPSNESDSEPQVESDNGSDDSSVSASHTSGDLNTVSEKSKGDGKARKASWCSHDDGAIEERPDQVLTLRDLNRLILQQWLEKNTEDDKAPKASWCSHDDGAIEERPDQAETLRYLVGLWHQERLEGAEQFTEVPIEVLRQGRGAIKAYYTDLGKSTPDDKTRRRKICLVGPSGWGKTSLVNSVTSLQPTLARDEDRTIGIEILPHEFTDSQGRRYEVTFWDFAGQDVYQAAHAHFFSERTLYFVCIDLDTYSEQLETSPDTMDRFVRRHIFRWVRLIFARQPNAEFVAVGTKADKLKNAKSQVNTVFYDFKTRLDKWKQAFQQELAGATRDAGANPVASLREEQSEHFVDSILMGEPLVVSCSDDAAVHRARDDLYHAIATSPHSFESGAKCSRVLAAVRERRRQCRDDDISIQTVHDLCEDMAAKDENISVDECRAFLGMLHELGDIMWFRRDDVDGLLASTVFLDPAVITDSLREVITHESKESRVDGLVAHQDLRKRSPWKRLSKDHTLQLKRLLQHLQLAYPADKTKMRWDSNLIVPAYWMKAKTASSRGIRQQSSQLVCHDHNHEGLDARVCWEYELHVEVAETIFSLLAVESYRVAVDVARKIVSNRCFEEHVAGRISVRRSEQHKLMDVVRFDVAATDTSTGWDRLGYYVIAMECVLGAYHGLLVSCFIVDTTNDDVSNRHDVHAAITMLDEAVKGGTSRKAVADMNPWLPSNLLWFSEAAWKNPKVLRELRMAEQTERTAHGVSAMRNMVIADTTARRFPQLWTVQYDKNEQGDTIQLRLLSDVSGNCFHDDKPIVLTVPPEFLKRHGSKIEVSIVLHAWGTQIVINSKGFLGGTDWLDASIDSASRTTASGEGCRVCCKGYVRNYPRAISGT
jgi:GTPase SAR1 family protein